MFVESLYHTQHITRTLLTISRQSMIIFEKLVDYQEDTNKDQFADYFVRTNERELV